MDCWLEKLLLYAKSSMQISFQLELAENLQEVKMYLLICDVIMSEKNMVMLLVQTEVNM